MQITATIALNARQRHRGEQHERDDDLQAHGLQRVGAGGDHAGHRPGLYSRQADVRHADPRVAAIAEP